MFRMVSKEKWILSDAICEERRSSLCDPKEPLELLETFLSQAKTAADKRALKLDWQFSDEAPGFGRVTGIVPLESQTFDQLFNGRSGYRAQYYLSPEEGVLYNRMLVDGLVDMVRTAYCYCRLDESLEEVLRSLRSPHAKIWVANEQAAFSAAAENSLETPRWVRNGATLGRRVPLLEHPAIDLKGGFISKETKDLFLDELKASRSCDLHFRGYS